MSYLSIEKLERFKELKAKLELIPQKPGVYIHKNQKNEVLYVGKAKNLRARLKSYFNSIEQQSLKTRALVEKIYDYEVIVTENEYESLLLENNLIKHNLPPYNILLRDDKTYPYIKISINEEWPRLILTRKRKKDSCLYFGPYTIVGQIHQVLNIINRFFPLVKCTPTVFKTVSRPCNYYDIKKCLGPCKLPVSKEEYNTHLENVIAVLNGNTKQITKKIREEMHIASNKQEYEKAAILRDQYNALANLNTHQIVSLDIPIYTDIIGYCWNNDLAVFYITFIRNGKLVGGKSIIVKDILFVSTQENMQEDIISSFICQYYSKNEIPDYILFPAAKEFFSNENFNNINKYILQQKSLAISQTDSSYQASIRTAYDIFSVASNEFLKNIKDDFKLLGMNNYKKIFEDLAKMSLTNAENKFQEQIKIDENSVVLLNDVKNVLGLSVMPRYIECFDISTFQGAQTVASQVAFKDGVVYKSGYKKYIIKEIVGKTDDFASLREVMRRRFKNLDFIPDLVVIDGGVPQIREVGWVLKSLGLEQIAFVGLAKARVQNNFNESNVTSSQERIVIPARNEGGELLPSAPMSTIVLKEGTPAFRLLTQLRDEAHRFAIQFHRKKRDQASMKSILFNINGLGAKRRKQLLEVYPDISQVLTENLNEVAKKTKIPLNILMELREKFKTQ